MATAADPAQIASQARRRYVDMLLKGLPALVARIGNGARELLDKPAEYATGQRRRDLVQGLIKLSGGWHGAMSHGLRHVLQHGITASQPGDLPPPGAGRPCAGCSNPRPQRSTPRHARSSTPRSSSASPPSTTLESPSA